MSKTFTSRPSVVRNRNPNTSDRNQQGTVPKTTANRGRGTTNMASGNRSTCSNTGIGRGRGTVHGAVGRGAVLQPEEALSGEPQVQPVEQRMSYQGGYTMISPNEKKKQEIQKQASREMESYQQYKEQRKVGHLNYVGTAGGGGITQEQARRKLIQENKNPNMRLREKREEYRLQQKKKEEEEINQKRDRQRELAEKNKSRLEQSEIDSRNRWDEDRKRKTDQFLSRFEGKSCKSKPQSEAVIESRPSVTENISSLRIQPNIQHDDTPIDTPGASWNGYSTTDSQNDLETLHSMFPHFDRTVLQELLNQTHSVEGALTVLHGE